MIPTPTAPLLVERLRALREVKISVMAGPHQGVADFDRELGDLFGVQLSPHNRWADAKLLRERWQAHIDAALVRPVLVVDEAQDMSTVALNEIGARIERDPDIGVPVGCGSNVTRTSTAPVGRGSNVIQTRE